MFLKRLDVVGFKSFAERISIDFVPGVTAVVGPNGSGKSNITDAVRWVLGEQSVKSLRGAKMEDIIFAGSDSRKPLNFAEVSLTLDNETQSLPIDFNEVNVMRRVYRSGESEFFINNQSCRLKDIIDLFLDSGLGREAFSIISQGKVEEILSSKPEDRRVIFEEAAGVLKYKTRKRKAETKLSETQDNLNRVHDILSELESQVEPLKIQASLAKEYIEKKNDLENFEVALTVYEIEVLHEKWTKLSVELEQHSALESNRSISLQKKEQEVVSQRLRLANIEELLSNYQETLLQTSEELEKLEGRKEVLKERKKNASLNRQQLEKSIIDGEKRVFRLSEEKEQEAKVLSVLKADVNQLQEQLGEKQKNLGLFKSNIEETIETLKSDYIEWLNKQASAKNETRYLNQQIEQHQQKNVRLDLENAKFLQQRAEIEAKKETSYAAFQTVEKQMEQSVFDFREAQKKLEQAQNIYQKQEKTLYQAYQYLQQSKSRKEMLEELEDDYAGFFQGVKEVLKERNKSLSGIEGAVAELIHVPRDYQIAIETALGGAMQHIVMETEEHSRKAIAFLKKNAFGRATFLPLSVIKSREIPQTQVQLMKNHPSFIGAAADLIQFDPKYKHIAANLLGTVVITNDLKGANDLAKMVNYKYRFVTIEGDIVNPGGSMTGGALKQKTTSLLSRKNELEEVKVKLVAMEDKTTRLEQHVKQLKADIGDQEGKVEEIRKSGESLRLKEQLLKGEIREIELQEKNMNERLHIYDLDKTALTEETKEKMERLKHLSKLLASCAQEISRLDVEIEELNNQKQIQQNSKETLSEEVNDLKVQVASKREQLQSQRERYSRIEQELMMKRDELAESKEDLSFISNEMTDSLSGEEILEAEAKRKLFDKNETMAHISARKQERAELQTMLEDSESEAKEIKRLQKGLLEAVKDEEVKLNRMDVELENKLTHLREEYSLTFEAAKEKYSLIGTPEEAKKQVKLVKLAIDELGTVNLGAIDEYDRVSTRYQFLLEQKNDLQQAKDTLDQVIEEMDMEMKRRFANTFNAIRDQFEGVFKSLFGGGRAELKLSNPQDLLKTGVDIIAQPPGKKQQNLALLSGGERALTAIALLFAILKVRPVPFCILDEVEAALDEANVLRFSQFLKKFSEETQFIVITHRKGTMEGADVLYGITMQESGVSKLVSVRLEETKEFAKQ